MCSFHSSFSFADERRSRLDGMHLAIKYLAGMWFVDTAKYHGSLSLNDSQIFKDSNCLAVDFVTFSWLTIAFLLFI